MYATYYVAVLGRLHIMKVTNKAIVVIRPKNMQKVNQT